MDKKTIFGAYFRQQAELLMPDPYITPEIVGSIGNKSPTVPVSPIPVKTIPEVAQKKKISPDSRTPSSSSLLNRLSSLRPVDQLITSIEQKTNRSTISSSGKTAVDLPAVPDKRLVLKELFITGCTRCHLSDTRTKFVFGSGNAEAPIMVIGEAPGVDEDAQGLPFVGAAGKLLTTMLAAIGIDRATDTFITNVLKCHPPENRDPDAVEINTCIPLLRRQIDIIRPKALLLLGRIAAHAVLEINDSVAKMRSRVFDVRNIPAMVIYHPAALLHNAEYKRPAWEDLQQFQKLLTTLGVYGSLCKK